MTASERNHILPSRRRRLEHASASFPGQPQVTKVIPLLKLILILSTSSTTPRRSCSSSNRDYRCHPHYHYMRLLCFHKLKFYRDHSLMQMQIQPRHASATTSTTTTITSACLTSAQDTTIQPLCFTAVLRGPTQYIFIVRTTQRA